MLVKSITNLIYGTILKSLLLLFLLHLSLFGHPHTFMDVYPTIKVEKGHTSSIHFKWVFDEMTSSMLIMDIDSNGNGKIEAKENFFIYANYFITLEDYGFYTHVTVDSKPVELPKPKNFKATIENHRVCYSFDIEANYDITKTAFSFGDEELYVACMLKKEFLNVVGAQVKITELKDDFFGYKLELQ